MYAFFFESCFTIRLIHRNCNFAIDIRVDLCDILQSNLLHCFVKNFLCFFSCIFFLIRCFFSQFLKFGFEFFLFCENLNSSEYFSNTKLYFIFHVFFFFDDFLFFHIDFHCFESLFSHSILFIDLFNLFHDSFLDSVFLFSDFFEKNSLSLLLKCI